MANYFTVRDLIEFITNNNIPMDARIYMQRVEDVYFNGVDIGGCGGYVDDNGVRSCFPPGSKADGWKTVKKEGYAYREALELNRRVDAGDFHNKEDFPDLEDPEVLRSSEERLEELKEQYYPCFSPVYYADQKDLFLDAHY